MYNKKPPTGGIVGDYEPAGGAGLMRILT